jgi:hypothetical protein
LDTQMSGEDHVVFIIIAAVDGAHCYQPACSLRYCSRVT